MNNQWYAASQLAGKPGMPRTRQGVLDLARRKEWRARSRSGQGGGKEFFLEDLPVETRLFFLGQNIQPSPDGVVTTLLNALNQALITQRLALAELVRIIDALQTVIGKEQGND